MMGQAVSFLRLRWLAVLLLSLLWATVSSAAALAERGGFGRCALAAKGGWRVGTTTRTVTEVPLSQINPLHPVPRPGVPAGHIDNIANSIRTNGYDVGQAIPVVRMPNGQLVSFGGHHRVAAMQQLGETTIPSRVSSWGDMSAKAQQTWLQRFPNLGDFMK